MTQDPTTFEEFMRRALYDPEKGYYSRQITGVGKRGDFTTAPMLGAGLARTIAAWATRALRETKARHLIEIGPGEGTLAAAMWRHLPLTLRLRTRLHLVETSTPLAEKQRTLLGKRATWHRDPAAAMRACGGRAVIYSNELVDAFPVRRFQKTTSGWQEIGVLTDSAGHIREILLESPTLPQSSGFSDHHPVGQCIEVHESYKRWLESWLPHWHAGRMLTIDYGATHDTLYHRQPGGTLRAYLMQQRLTGPEIYANVGRQDLTADVNFTDLDSWAKPWVAHSRTVALRDFLIAQNIDDPLLRDPHGPGTAFLCLEQSR